MVIEFEGTVFRWAGDDASAWFFVAVPAELSEDIRVSQPPRRGFGSVRVRAHVGGSEWTTSIFPSAAWATYVLPLKKAVREAEGLIDGGPIAVRLELLVG